MPNSILSIFLLTDVDGKYFTGQIDKHSPEGEKPIMTSTLSQALQFDTYEDADGFRTWDSDSHLFRDFSVEEYCI